MSETQEIKDGLTVLEETEGREDATYDHIVKYTGFLGGIQVLTILVSVVRNKLAAVLLSTAGVGLSALYQSVIGFLHNTSNLGISFSSIKEIAEYYGENHPEKVLLQVEVVRTWSVWTGLAGMLLCLLFSPSRTAVSRRVRQSIESEKTSRAVPTPLSSRAVPVVR